MYVCYSSYKYYKKVMLIHNIKNMIIDLDYNNAIDIIKFCDCKYQIAQFDDIEYFVDDDDRKFTPCPIFSYDPNLVIYIEDNKVTNCVLIY